MPAMDLVFSICMSSAMILWVGPLQARMAWRMESMNENSQCSGVKLVFVLLLY